MANITARAHMQNLISQGFPDDQHSLVERTIADLGISRSRAHDVWHSLNRQKVMDMNKSGISRSQLKDKFDSNTKARNAIRRGLETLVEMENPEDDPILDEAQFRSERCGDVNTVGFRRIADEPEFIKYQFRVGDKIFWTTLRTKQWALENVSRARDI